MTNKIILAAAIVATCEAVRGTHALSSVALSGGVFLNVLLTGLCVDRLLDRDFRVLRHSEVPPSDAGIALGQLVIGAQISGGRG